MANPNDAIRDAILRHLYGRHKAARGPKAVGVKIRDLQAAMKKAGIGQQETNSSLDYLIQKGWVREMVTERSFTTAGGTQMERPSTAYKISDLGIDLLESASVFRRDQPPTINITTIRGVTIVGDGNTVVHTGQADLYQALDDLESAVAAGEGLSDSAKLSATYDIRSLKYQLGKPQLDRALLVMLWDNVRNIVTGAQFAELVHRVATHMSTLVS